ncbi:MAG: N-formylglutamate amidohydrolase [Novosphingobium sp.]
MAGFDTDRVPGQLWAMTDSDDQSGDSRRDATAAIGGGQIPESPGVPAFMLTAPQPSGIPVLIAVPHAGRAYPGSLIERMRNPGFAALRLEDRYVDLVAKAVASATGAALLVAQAPRAMIDLNRAADDVDWDMFGAGSSNKAGDSSPDSYAPGRRSRSGLGLIPRRLPGIGELWKRRHEEVDLQQRIELIHQPYHACLSDALHGIRDRWGRVLLVDLHSMPPLAPQGGQPAPEFVLGDRFGAACEGSLVASAFAYFSEMRRCAAHNRPYAGGYVLERHARPLMGVNALQLEIDRTSYLDGRLSEPGRGLQPMIHLLSGLIRRLAGEVAELGRLTRGAEPGDNNWAVAAE